MKVYLAGPITGLTYDGATEWRDKVKEELWKYDVKGLSPMRGKAYLSAEDKIADSYSDKTMSSITAINLRDRNDVKTSDAILVNLLGAKTVSIGTVMEIAWAIAYDIPCVIVMEKTGNIHEHGMLTFRHIIVDNLNEGVKAILQIVAA